MPNCVDNRTAANSALLSDVLTRSTQPGIRGIRQGDSSGCLGSGFCSHRYSQPQEPAHFAVDEWSWNKTLTNGHRLKRIQLNLMSL